MSTREIGAMALTVMLLVVPVTSRAQVHGCKPKQYAELPVTYTRAGGVIVPVTIDGKPESMVMNLGSAYSLLSRAGLGELGLKVFHASAVFKIGGRSSNEFTKVGELRLGDVRYPGWDLLLFGDPNEASNIEPGEPIGIIGADLFHYFDLELDLARDRVRIFSHERCGGAAPVYWTDHYDVVPLRPGMLRTLYFVMELDGKKLETTLATNSGLTSIYTEATKAAYGWDETAPEVQVISTENGRTEERYRAMSLTAPGLNVTDAKIRLVKTTGCITAIDKRDGAYGFRECYGLYPLTLGVDVLKKLRIYMAVRAEHMYVSAWDAQ